LRAVERGLFVSVDNSGRGRAHMRGRESERGLCVGVAVFYCCGVLV